MPGEQGKPLSASGPGGSLESSGKWKLKFLGVGAGLGDAGRVRGYIIPGLLAGSLR